jgi:multidrug efflux pump subunit AcrA (membrane-fusion protein)
MSSQTTTELQAAAATLAKAKAVQDEANAARWAARDAGQDTSATQAAYRVAEANYKTAYAAHAVAREAARVPSPGAGKLTVIRYGMVDGACTAVSTETYPSAGEC